MPDRCLLHRATDELLDRAVEVGNAAAAPAPRCPCCGGRMIVIETFPAGATPRRPPAAARRIDTS